MKQMLSLRRFVFAIEPSKPSSGGYGSGGGW
jgi:hypothetical protein